MKAKTVTDSDAAAIGDVCGAKSRRLPLKLVWAHWRRLERPQALRRGGDD